LLVSAAVRTPDSIDRVQGREQGEHRGGHKPSHGLIISRGYTENGSIDRVRWPAKRARRHEGRKKGRQKGGRCEGVQAPQGGAEVAISQRRAGGSSRRRQPQIAKADGDAPVQAYIAAMPGWKRDVGRRLDALIVRTVPDVRKAVKWNSPFYGIDGGIEGSVEVRGWFLRFHCFTNYVKVAFFRGASLRPLPPGESKQKDVRYVDIHENDQLGDELIASWIRQASELPGWVP
jgi:hypothetical protein